MATHSSRRIEHGTSRLQRTGAVRRRPGMSSAHRQRVLRLVSVDAASGDLVLTMPPDYQIEAEALRSLIHQRWPDVVCDAATLEQTAVATPQRRRLVLAAGAAEPEALRIRVAPDRMLGEVLIPAGIAVSVAELRTSMQAAGLRYGFDRAAILNAVGRAHDHDRRITIARGLPPRRGRSAGFQLTGSGPRLVAPGARVAEWLGAEQPRSGRNVMGDTLLAPASPHQRVDPEQLAGPGTILRGTPPAPCHLEASAAGTAYQRPDGTIAVAEVEEVNGDLRGEDESLATNKVPMIRGSIVDGGTVTCTGDCLVEGSIGSATLRIGGDLIVTGSIEAGAGSITVAGTVTCKHVTRRSLEAGSLRCEGRLVDADVVAVERVQAQHAVGGRIVCGGSIHLRRAGNTAARPTMLWTGKDLDPAQLGGLARMRYAGRVAERHRALSDLAATCWTLGELAKSLQRLDGAAVFDRKAVKELEQRFSDHMRAKERGERMTEQLREEIQRLYADGRAALEQMEEAGERVVIEVMERIYPGVRTKVADRPTERLASLRHRYRRTISQAVLSALDRAAVEAGEQDGSSRIDEQTERIGGT